MLPLKRIFPYTTRPIPLSSTQSNFSNVHFLDPIQVFTVGSDGGVFHSALNDITIKFPKGAVPESSLPVTVQFGVALNGPFDIPVGKKPVSPFMWFCTDVPNFVFHTPVEITMPHYISLTESDSNKLKFMKAKHEEGDKDDFLFKDCTDPMRFKARSNHGVLLTKHSDFLCITAEISESTIMKANYCLMKVTPKACDNVFKVYFIVTYFLQTCMEVCKHNQYVIECQPCSIAIKPTLTTLIFWKMIIIINKVYFLTSNLKVHAGSPLARGDLRSLNSHASVLYIEYSVHAQ